MNQTITLRHGDGGLHTNRLIHDIFYRHFDNDILRGYQDAAIVSLPNDRIAFTTDSFVVNPLFFKGGNIGKLAVCGTANDLAAAGAMPLYLSTGFVIEEGFRMDDLNTIAASMSQVCKEIGAIIVTGDTKVVEKGTMGGVHINTAGIGTVHPAFHPRSITSGDEILLTGTVAEHGTAILLERNTLDIRGDFASDCAPLTKVISALGDQMQYVKLMRDPTRGGLATALCELADSIQFGAVIDEDEIPLRPAVTAVHALLGTDPLYFACEGRMLLVVEKGRGKDILSLLRSLPCCENANKIGTFDSAYNKVCIRTALGGERILSMLENQMISRIC